MSGVSGWAKHFGALGKLTSGVVGSKQGRRLLLSGVSTIQLLGKGENFPLPTLRGVPRPRGVKLPLHEGPQPLGVKLPVLHGSRGMNICVMSSSSTVMIPSVMQKFDKACWQATACLPC